MENNLLSLFDCILVRVHYQPEKKGAVVNQLRHIALQLGMDRDTINMALDCDRDLVVYEP
jgi:hypothetical protein